MEDSSCHPQRQEQEPQTSEQWSSSQTLTPLGIKLLQIQVQCYCWRCAARIIAVNVYLSLQPMCELLFLSSFCALTWSDIHTVVKCSSVAGLIFEKVCLKESMLYWHPSSLLSTIAFSYQVLQVLQLLVLHLCGTQSTLETAWTAFQYLLVPTSQPCL